ncbi:hypothetical protein HOLleu_41718 [Holothuria leucospilota]|uniref:Uncharacterized protein n=1 Tax=Holothuria leucospilota TaxID=206669 RepID=A0A9Q0YDV3_HOLLE|nr:hypothetical protein HOLleu_41718 [Holothuria leucospilota]
MESHLFKPALQVINGTEEGIGLLLESLSRLSETRITAVRGVADSAMVVVLFLRGSLLSLAEHDLPEQLSDFAEIIGHTMAICSVLHGNSVCVKKEIVTCPHEIKRSLQKRLDKIEALGSLLQDVSNAKHNLINTCESIVKWLEKNKQVSISSEEGDVPLIDVFVSRAQSKVDSKETFAEKATDLIGMKPSDQDTTVSFETPTTEQIVTLINLLKKTLNGLKDFVNYANENKSKYPEVEDLPVSLDDMDELSAELQSIDLMPYT